MAVTKEDVAKIFPTMLERIDAKKTEGINATIQFDLSGENGGMWWLKIADDGADVGEGAVDSKMTLKATADDFMSMMSGGLNPMQAFMMGRIKVVGDTGLALKLMPLING